MPKIKPRQDVKLEKVQLGRQERNLELSQVGDRDGLPFQNESNSGQELDHDHPEDEIEDGQDDRGRRENDVTLRRDRMDDFEPFGGLVPVNETLLMAVGLVNEKV